MRIPKFICLFYFVLVPAFAALALLGQEQPATGKNAARVQVVNGYYCFILSRPATPFKHIGTVVMPPDSLPFNKVAALVAALHDSVPAADGFIIPGLNIDTVYIIQFKKQ